MWVRRAIPFSRVIQVVLFRVQSIIPEDADSIDATDQEPPSLQGNSSKLAFTTPSALQDPSALKTREL